MAETQTQAAPVVRTVRAEWRGGGPLDARRPPL